MNRLLIVLLLMGLPVLGGCAQLQNTWDTLSGATVSPTTLIIAANGFDAAEASATEYLKWCKANLSQPACSKSNLTNVVAGVRAGRTARNNLEPYITSGKAGPVALYNTLVATVTTLQSAIPATGAAK